MVKKPFQNSAVWNQRYKLIINPGTAFDTSFKPGQQKHQLELYDIENDPAERNNIASSKQDIVNDLRSQYEHWFGEMQNTRGFQPGLIHIDPSIENQTLLCRYQDANHDYYNSAPSGWPVRLERTGDYRISIINSTKLPFSLDELWETYSSADIVVEWQNCKKRVSLSPKLNSTEVHLNEGNSILDAYFEVRTEKQIQQIRKGEVVVEYISSKK